MGGEDIRLHFVVCGSDSDQDRIRRQHPRGMSGPAEPPLESTPVPRGASATTAYHEARKALVQAFLFFISLNA